MLRSILTSVLLAATLIFFGSVYAQDKANENSSQRSQKYERSIGEIGEKIKSISRNLNANKALVASERDALLKAEREIVKIRSSLQKIDYELAKSQHELDGLTRQIIKAKRSQTRNSDAFKGLLVSRYFNGKPDLLKKLLNQENPYAVGRLANYNYYFAMAFEKRIHTLRKQVEELEILNKNQTFAIEVLSKEKAKQKTAELSLKRSTDDRSRTIASLDQKITTNAELLATLKNDRSRLRSLLSQLKRQSAELKRLADLKVQESEQQKQQQNTKKNRSRKAVVIKPVKGGFLKQKGRLSYPVEGTITRSFGSILPKSGMRSEGSFFNTKGSVSVKSIFRGRVLFADFLKGYGLLIIVDHGDNHISLYGHNDRLLKNVGDKIASGEVIAKSGVTGGLKTHGLYFEIRDNATPIDASKWCR